MVCKLINKFQLPAIKLKDCQTKFELPAIMS